MRRCAILKSKAASSEITWWIGCNDAFHVSEKGRIPLPEDEKSSLVDISSLLQEVSLRLCNVEQRLGTPLGYFEFCDTSVP